MTQYYSAKTGEFYDSHIHQTLPNDAVEVTAQMHQALLNAMAQGTRIGDPNNILATRKYVNDAMQENRQQSDQRYWHRDEKLFPDAEKGYQVLPSGLILQWGMAEVRSASNDDSSVISFPLSFPNEVLSIQLTHNATGKNLKAHMMFHYQNIDNTKFSVRSDWFDQHPAFTTTSWLALGY